MGSMYIFHCRKGGSEIFASLGAGGLKNICGIFHFHQPPLQAFVNGPLSHNDEVSATVFPCKIMRKYFKMDLSIA